MMAATKRVALMMDQCSFRDTLAFRLSAENDLRVVSVHNSDACRATIAIEPDVIVYQPSTQTQLLSICEDVATLRVLLLLESSSDATIGCAVRAGVLGCVLTTDRVDVLLDGIREVAAGECWFSETIRERLVFDEATQSHAVASPNGLSSLTRRQFQLLGHVAEGRTNREAAQLMGLAVKSVETHMYRMMQRIGVRNRMELVCLAIREGVVVL